jgi:hypothetical protein
MADRGVGEGGLVCGIGAGVGRWVGFSNGGRGALPWGESREMGAGVGLGVGVG